MGIEYQVQSNIDHTFDVNIGMNMLLLLCKYQ